MPLDEVRITGDQLALLNALVGRRAIALISRIFKITDMETMRPGLGDFWLCHVERGDDPLSGRFLHIGNELVSGPGYVDAPVFRFEEAEAPTGLPAQLDTSLGFPRVLCDCSELSLHDEIVRVVIYEETWDEEGLRVRRDCAIKLEFSEGGRSLVLLVDDISGPVVTAGFTPKGVNSLTRFLSPRTILA